MACIRETRPSGFIKMEVLVLVVCPPNTLSAASFNTKIQAYGLWSGVLVEEPLLVLKTRIVEERGMEQRPS